MPEGPKSCHKISLSGERRLAMENYSRALGLSLQPGITAPWPVSFITTGSRLSMIQCTAEEIKPRERGMSVYWLWLVSLVHFPNSYLGLRQTSGNGHGLGLEVLLVVTPQFQLTKIQGKCICQLACSRPRRPSEGGPFSVISGLVDVRKKVWNIVC